MDEAVSETTLTGQTQDGAWSLKITLGPKKRDRWYYARFDIAIPYSRAMGENTLDDHVLQSFADGLMAVRDGKQPDAVLYDADQCTIVHVYRGRERRESFFIDVRLGTHLAELISDRSFVDGPPKRFDASTAAQLAPGPLAAYVDQTPISESEPYMRTLAGRLPVDQSEILTLAQFINEHVRTHA